MIFNVKVNAVIKLLNLGSLVSRLSLKFHTVHAVVHKSVSLRCLFNGPFLLCFSMDGRNTRKKENVYNVALNRIIQTRIEQIMRAKHAEAGGYVAIAFGYIVFLITNHGLRGSTSSGVTDGKYLSLQLNSREDAVSLAFSVCNSVQRSTPASIGGATSGRYCPST